MPPVPPWRRRPPKTRVQRRDPSGTYNKIDRAGLARLAPGWSWDAYFKGLGFDDVRDINVTAPGFLRGSHGLTADRSARCMGT
jgi:predicted metalloendopeptidase